MTDRRPWLLLDLAGVLLRFRPDRRLDRLRELSGLDEAAVRARLSASAIGDRLDDGSAGTDELAAFISELAGRKVDAREAWATWLLPFTPDGRTMAQLPALAARHRLAVFTNNAARITDTFDASPFERLFFSAELGVRKPDGESYRRVALLLDVPPRDILFVDDGKANVEAARAAGWRAALFTEGADLQACVAAA